MVETRSAAEILEQARAGVDGEGTLQDQVDAATNKHVAGLCQDTVDWFVQTGRITPQGAAIAYAEMMKNTSVTGGEVLFWGRKPTDWVLDRLDNDPEMRARLTGGGGGPSDFMYQLKKAACKNLTKFGELSTILSKAEMDEFCQVAGFDGPRDLARGKFGKMPDQYSAAPQAGVSSKPPSTSRSSSNPWHSEPGQTEWSPGQLSAQVAAVRAAGSDLSKVAALARAANPPSFIGATRPGVKQLISRY